MKLRDGNRLTLLESGDTFFPRLEHAINSAEREVHIETYIFEDDPTGRRIAEVLAGAARRGVTIRLLVDGFGSDNLAPSLRALLEPAGVQILIYRPAPQRVSFYRHHLRRLHRKLAVIDGNVAFCGGLNLKDDRDGDATTAPRYDFAVEIQGPLVGDVHRAARRLWLLTQWMTFGRGRLFRMPRAAPPSPLLDGQPASFVTRDNWLNRRRIEDAYLDAIQRGQHEIVIANAYFLPGRRMRQALLAAARRGVRVRLLLQGQPDHLLVHYATQALYGALIEAGIELHEYTAAHLHAKVAVIDSAWATVGSSNIDPFSLWLSREANVIFHDRHLVGTLRASLERAIAHHAQPITRDFTARQSLLWRFRAWLMYRVGRVLVGVTGFATRDEL
jgi:cardiolipin synthase A/B